MNSFRYLISTAVLVLATFLCCSTAAAQNSGTQISASPARTDFALMTDLHIATGARAIKDLSMCIADVNAMQGAACAPQFVIVSGDLTDFGTDEQLKEVKQQLDSLKVPYYVVPGNHDAKWSESGCNSFVKTFGYESFDFRIPGYRIIGCPSGPDMRMAPALVPRNSIKWLQDLARDKKSTDDPVIFINHYPADTMVLNYCALRTALRALDTRIVMGGHVHRNMVMNYDGIPGVLNRSTLSGKDRTGYSLITIDNGSIIISERNPATDTQKAQTTPWYTRKLEPVGPSSANPDAHGLPADFPWMRYDVNKEYSDVQELWRIDEDSNIASGFAYDGRRRACYATETGILKCIDTADGRQIWEASLPGKVFSTPVIACGKVLVGCADGGMYAFSLKNGHKAWMVPTDKSVLATAAVYKGVAFFGASDGVFRAVSLKDGSLKWQFTDVQGFVEDVPYVDAHQVVFGSWGRRLYSLDTATGELQWCWESPKHSVMYSPAACNPVKAAGRIFQVSPDRLAHVHDATTGKEIATVDGGREALCLSDKGDMVFVKSMHNRLYAIPSAGDVVDGTIAKSWEIVSGLGYDIATTSLYEKAGILYVPTDKGNVVAYRASDGTLLWKHKIALGLVNPLMAIKSARGRQTVLVSTMDGAVCALDCPSIE